MSAMQVICEFVFCSIQVQDLEHHCEVVFHAFKICHEHSVGSGVTEVEWCKMLNEWRIKSNKISLSSIENVYGGYL